MIFLLFPNSCGTCLSQIKREFSPDLLSVCIEHDRGYGRNEHHKHFKEHQKVDVNDGDSVSSPFYDSIMEEFGCLYEWDSMDNSRSAMIDYSTSNHSYDYEDYFDGNEQSLDLSTDSDASFSAGLAGRMKPLSIHQKKKRKRRQNVGIIASCKMGVATCCLKVERCLGRFLMVPGVTKAEEDEENKATTYPLSWDSVRTMYFGMLRESNANEDGTDLNLKVSNCTSYPAFLPLLENNDVFSEYG